MDRWLLVAAGGALGAMARYGTGGQVARWLGPSAPFGAATGTFAVNILGGLLMGLLAGWLAWRGEGGETWRLFLGVGVLGGFTTFSAFSLDLVLMVERRDYAQAAAYGVLSALLAAGALFAGLIIARRMFA